MPIAESDFSNHVIIIGAGPAGLTAAYELLRQSEFVPIIIEQSEQLGGISKTIQFKGNRIDIGGHRFFSKSQRVLDWWQQFLPVQRPDGLDPEIDLHAHLDGPDPAATDRVMLIRRRVSRIFFARRFFDYPLRPSLELAKGLGIGRSLAIFTDYLWTRFRPIHPEISLEDFLINRFGRRLYRTFFEDYTEKLWGVPCSKLKPEWGAQRIKGLSLRKAVMHGLLPKPTGTKQSKVETSLIGRFHYPKLGPGQMWETVAERVMEMGGEFLMEATVRNIEFENGRASLVSGSTADGSEFRFTNPRAVISSMAIKDLLGGQGTSVPDNVRAVASDLQYRDFITVGLLGMPGPRPIPPDNWIYIQEPGLKLGRVQIFNNWSPYMVQDPENLWIGLEYFATEGDSFWNLEDDEIIEIAKHEISQVGLMKADEFRDAVVIRQRKAYPAYLGSYDRLDEIRTFVDSIKNLFLVGRNGTHRYNNQDHSMLSAMKAIDAIVDPSVQKSSVWDVNTEEKYHE